MEERRRYLLLMGCSERNRSQHGLVPAIELYDGVFSVIVPVNKPERYPVFSLPGKAY